MKEGLIIRPCGWWGSHHPKIIISSQTQNTKKGITNKQQYFLKTKTPPAVMPAEAGIQTYSLRIPLN